jgi:hypothetical protein
LAAPTPLSSLRGLVSSLFGPSFGVSRGYSTSHDGIDLSAPKGTPVYALTSGTAVYARNASTDKNCAKNWACGGGNVVNIKTPDGLVAQYAHLDAIIAREGKAIVKGALIGRVGSTGNATGNHLHFGLWDTGQNKMIDPLGYLKKLTVPSLPPLTGDGSKAFPIPLNRKGDPDACPAGFNRGVVTEGFDPLGFLTGKDWTNKETLGPGEANACIHTSIGAGSLNFQYLGAGAQQVAEATGVDVLIRAGQFIADPANWARILAVAGGAALAGVGGWRILAR